ncbi:hypothetical protein QTP70_033196, partial [Hemibagrus guttatus]
TSCIGNFHVIKFSGLILLAGIQMLSVQPDTKPKGCAGCNRKIKDRYLLKALDKYWHEDCLKCACCDCRLGEVGSTLYTKANLILCRRDYLRLFGVTGNCAACSKLIPAFEMVMRAKENVYHLDCFACQLCNQRWRSSFTLLIHSRDTHCKHSTFPQVLRGGQILPEKQHDLVSDGLRRGADEGRLCPAGPLTLTQHTLVGRELREDLKGDMHVEKLVVFTEEMSYTKEQSNGFVHAFLMKWETQT